MILTNISSPVEKRDDTMCSFDNDNQSYTCFIMPDEYEYTNVTSFSYTSVTMQYIGISNLI